MLAVIYSVRVTNCKGNLLLLKVIWQSPQDVGCILIQMI